MSTTTDQRDELARALKDAIILLNSYQELMQKLDDNAFSHDYVIEILEVENFIDEWKTK